MGAWSIPVKAVLAHYVLSGDAAGEDVPAYMKWLFKVDTKARTAYSYADHDYGRRRDLETAVSSFLVTQRQGTVAWMHVCTAHVGTIQHTCCT